MTRNFLSAARAAPAWFWIWLVLAALMLFARPAVPLDETRYLAAAWEMWWRGSVAVPYLNGAYYDGKPPLFFWLMHAGWSILGVNEWWPRLLAPLFGLGSLLLVRDIAYRLWGNHEAARLAPLILLGSFYWALFCASTMFDMLLGFLALLSVHAVIRAWQEGRARHFCLAGAALGCGILAKGPVVFLPALFIVVFAPWWMGGHGAARPGSRVWVGGALAAVGIATLVALAWLVPMALGSDRAYLENMTIKQTTGYVVDSFAHRRPFWWYLPLLPLLLFPWTFWPRCWSALWAMRKTNPDPGLRLCMIWAIGVFIVFSLVSGKQPHYLLLIFPAVTLLLARLLPEVDGIPDRSLYLPAAAFVIAGAGFIAAGSGAMRSHAAAWLALNDLRALTVTGGGLIGIALAMIFIRGGVLSARIKALAAATCASILLLVWGVMHASGLAYDLRPASRFVSQLQSQGAALAIASGYHGQFSFYGRVKTLIEKIPSTGAVAWSRAHPGGYVIAFYPASRWPLAAETAPLYQSLYRSGGMAVWRTQDIVKNPRLAEEFR